MDLISKQIRRQIIECSYNANAYSHFGGALSMCEILLSLYRNVINYNPNNLQDNNRDRVIVSKGHGYLALYAVFNVLKIITDKELYSYKSEESWLTTHPTMNTHKGIEFSSGSLGQGLGLGIGTAIALKKQNISSRVFVILGDGECQEGSIWEGAMFASTLKLDNIVIIIDDNNMQIDDISSNIISTNQYHKMFKSFEWETMVINGHDINQLTQSLSKHYDKPTCIIAKTIKGKGVSFMENNPKWHMGKLTKQEYEQAVMELS